MVELAERFATHSSDKLNRRHDIAFVFFGAWMATAAYADVWSHFKGRPETFFSLWHLLLYAGFGSALVYFALADWKERRRNGRSSIDRLGVWGLILFGLASIGDFIWHQIFGLETGLETFLAPNHLGLILAGLLIATAPFRSGWKRKGEQTPSFREFLPTLLSLTLATSGASLFLSYLSAFLMATLASPRNDVVDFLHHVQGVGSVLVTTVLLLVPTLLVLRRWRPPPASFTILYSSVALATITILSLRWPLMAVPGLVGGLVADTVIWSTRRRPRRATARWVGVLVPAIMWTSWVGAVHATEGVEWSIELVGGMVVLATLTGLVLSILAFPMKLPADQPTEAATTESY